MISQTFQEIQGLWKAHKPRREIKWVAGNDSAIPGFGDQLS